MSELYTAQLLGKPFTTQSMMGSPGVVQGVAGCRGLHGEHLGVCHVEEQAQVVFFWKKRSAWKLKSQSY